MFKLQEEIQNFFNAHENRRYILVELYFSPLQKLRKNPKVLYRGALRMLTVLDLDIYKERLILYSYKENSNHYYAGILFYRENDFDHFIEKYHEKIQEHSLRKPFSEEERTLYIRIGFIKNQRFYNSFSYECEIGGEEIDIKNFRYTESSLYIYPRISLGLI